MIWCKKQKQNILDDDDYAFMVDDFVSTLVAGKDVDVMLHGVELRYANTTETDLEFICICEEKYIFNALNQIISHIQSFDTGVTGSINHLLAFCENLYIYGHESNKFNTLKKVLDEKIKQGKAHETNSFSHATIPV